MKILVTGAYGFIGTEIVAYLRNHGHTIVCAVRDAKQASRLFNSDEIILCDFRTDTSVDLWLPRLRGIQAVVNCVGILQTRSIDAITNIHYATPMALFKACSQLGIQKIVHISALGANSDVDTPYASTKSKLEEFLKQSDMPWVIFRPSILYGPGASGGTALFRGLAGLPGILPLVGDGKQQFQPIHIRDLAKAVLIAIENPSIQKVCLNAVGPTPVILKDILLAFRKWLGFGKAIILPIPLFFMKIGAFFGNYVHELPINKTALKMLEYPNVADPKPFSTTMGFVPVAFPDGLMQQPSTLQDRWHARLYFLKPTIRVVIGLIWIAFGAIALFFAKTLSMRYLQIAGYSSQLSEFILYVTSILNLILGGLVLAGIKLRLVGTIQIIMLCIYTYAISVALPNIWLDPLGAVLKNIALILLTLVMMALEEKR